MRTIIIPFAILFGTMTMGCASNSRVDVLESRIGQVESNLEETQIQLNSVDEKASMANTRIDRMWQKLMGK